MKRRYCLFLLSLILIAPMSLAAGAGLEKNDRVAIVGDSITEQKIYSVFIEDYLLMCRPAADLKTMNFGWGGETSWGFLGRMNNDAAWFNPTVATTCYGMNDGGYSPMTDEKARRYKDAQRGIVRELKKWGARTIIVGSPGVVDANTFRNNKEMAAMYNKTLAALRDIARDVATEEGVVFANVYDPMMQSMTQAKAKYGDRYHVAGGDGVHPDQNGQLVMAYAFLKAMGCDGNIGTFTIDMNQDQASATDGHKVRSFKDGAVEIESEKYPFCFFGDPASPSATRGIIEFIPFNQELNRLTLIVKNAPAKARITWGKQSKEFTAVELEKGINLAAEFLDNPFCEPFAKAEQAIKRQQQFETPLHKDLIHSMARFKGMVPGEEDAFDNAMKAAIKRSEQLRKQSAEAVAPVRHTIKIEPVQ